MPSVLFSLYQFGFKFLHVPSCSLVLHSHTKIQSTLNLPCTCIPTCNCPWCPQILGVDKVVKVDKMLSYVEALASSVMIFGDGR